MKCEVEYCLYNRGLKCIIRETEINSLGMCDECIVVSFDKDFVEKEKKRQLLELEDRWSES